MLQKGKHVATPLCSALPGQHAYPSDCYSFSRKLVISEVNQYTVITESVFSHSKELSFRGGS